MGTDDSLKDRDSQLKQALNQVKVRVDLKNLLGRERVKQLEEQNVSISNEKEATEQPQLGANKLQTLNPKQVTLEVLREIGVVRKRRGNVHSILSNSCSKTNSKFASTSLSFFKPKV